ANGAMDQYSARAANILAGNPEDDPLLEVTVFDAQFSVTADALIAVTGADCELRVGDAVAPSWEPVSVRAGQPISLQQIRGAIRGHRGEQPRGPQTLRRPEPGADLTGREALPRGADRRPRGATRGRTAGAAPGPRGHRRVSGARRGVLHLPGHPRPSETRPA